jgi:hypothetical protein
MAGLFLTIMLIKDYYKPEKGKELNGSTIEKIKKANDGSKAIILVEANGKQDFFGVNDKIVLEKSLGFYSKKEGFRICWFYFNEMNPANNQN